MPIEWGGKHSSADAPPASAHLRDLRGLVAAVGIDAIDQGDRIADLVHGHIEDRALLVERTSMNLG